MRKAFIKYGIFKMTILKINTKCLRESQTTWKNIYHPSKRSIS